MELTTIQKICVWFMPILFAITVHEVAHGWVASWFGDQTARFSGRLTLNPIKHIDVVGTLVVPFIFLTLGGFIFGWAKPVPVDARNLRNPRWHMALVAAAGPLTNGIMAVIWGLLAKLGLYLFDQRIWSGEFVAYMGAAGIIINVVLAVLNCLPIPPLDGGRILMSILPGRWSWRFNQWQATIFLMLVLLMLTGWLSAIINPPIEWLIQRLAMMFDLPFTIFSIVS